VVNQLHALRRDLVPGGAGPTDLSAAKAATLLARIRPTGPAEVARKELARDIVAEIRALDARLKANEARIRQILAAYGSTLTETDGIGPLTAARLLGRTGQASRFSTCAAYATYTGTAPVEVASGERARHRLSRGGDRRLNAALHVVAITQIRMTSSAGRAYYQRKTAEGKTHKEALRCLKRRLADHVRRVMLADEQRRNQPPNPNNQAA
jgi:transposase